MSPTKHTPSRPVIPHADDMVANRDQYGDHRAWMHAIGVAERASWMAMSDLRSLAKGFPFTADQKREWDALEAKNASLTELRENSEIDRSQIIDQHVDPVDPMRVTDGGGGFRNGPFEGIPGVTSDGVLSSWSAHALDGMRAAMGETAEQRSGNARPAGPGQRVLRSGSLTVRAPLMPEQRAPGDSLPEPQKVQIDGPMEGRMPTDPTRILDLLVTRKYLTGTNEFSWLVQTLRENNARTVPDRARKPVSRYRMEEKTDHCRVIAHLSEPAPMRFFDDVVELGRFLQTEMELGLLDAIEWNIVSGDGVSDATTDNMVGLLNAEGTHTQAWDTSLERTLRKARTTLKVAAETPTAWVLHPEQTEAIDLLREGADGAFLNGQFSENIMGRLPVVESTAIDPEVAVLGDWRTLRLVVRDQGRLDVDMGGELFQTNQAQLRLEGRYGMELLRTPAFNFVNVSGSGPAPVPRQMASPTSNDTTTGEADEADEADEAAPSESPARSPRSARKPKG